MADLNNLNLVGMVFAIFYVVAGVYNMSQVGYNFDTFCSSMVSMRFISSNLFLVFFGLAAAFMCHTTSSDFGRWFFFLYTWLGKGIFFTVMGFYLDMQFCPGNHNACLNGNNLFSTCGVIAAVGSIILGVVIIILRILGNLGDNCSYTASSTRELQLPEICAAIASVGMLVIGVQLTMTTLNNTNKTWESFFHLAALCTILLVFGLGSLLAALRSSPFFQTFFGFLSQGWQRGVFYFLMGWWTLPVAYDGCNRWGSKTEWKLDVWVIVICSTVSIIIGVVFIVQGCCR